MITNALVVIPAYNEEKNIKSVLSDLERYFTNIVVINDGSNDGTAKICQECSSCLVINHIFNIGQGGAIQTGIYFFLESTNFDYLITFDADGQHQASDAYNMVECLEYSNSELVVGTRFKLSSSINLIPYSKRLTLLLATRIENFITGLTLSDAHNGLRVITRKACKSINLLNMNMAHSTEILMTVSGSGHKVIEYPVTIKYKRYGQSPLNSFNILLDLFLNSILFRK